MVSRSGRQRNFFLSLLFILGALFGAPIVSSNLALSAWETDLIQLVLTGGTVFFLMRGIRATGARGQTQVPDPAGGRRKLDLIAGAALAVVAFVAVLLVGKRG